MLLLSVFLVAINHRIVISDVRYRNEIEWVHDNGGEIWLIRRPNAPKIEYGENHPSETELDLFESWDQVIVCEEGIENVQNAIDRILRVEI